MRAADLGRRLLSFVACEDAAQSEKVTHAFRITRPGNDETSTR